MITGLWHVCHLFLLLSLSRPVYSTLSLSRCVYSTLSLPRRSKQTMMGWMDDEIDEWNDVSHHDILYYISLGGKWWQILLGRKMPCSQWEGPSMHSRHLAFYSFFPLRRGEGFFFHFSIVPTMFPLGSQWVLNMSPKFPMCSQHVFHSTSFISHKFWQMLSSFHLYRCAKGNEIYTSKQNLLF